MHTLLIVDDETNMLYSLQKELQTDTLRVATAATGQQGLAALKETSPDAVLLDVRLPDKSGLDLLDEIRSLDARLPVIMMTAFSNTEMAINATQRGAYDFLSKPVPLQKLRSVVSQAIELRGLNDITAELEHEQTEVGHSDLMIGNSVAMQDVYKLIGRVAQQNVNVLICGESGTGKELCARSIHFYGRGAERPFVAVNAAAIPEPLLESELFGHERGAFTGADKRRIGKFEQAHDGTLFLDEIGDMPLSLQAKLLRSIQEGQFERVGGNKVIRGNVRFVAATNQDLTKLIEQGRFRSDLYYRLNGFTINLPRLRDRTEDIPSLLRYFMDRLRSETNREIRGVAPGVIQMLQRHTWPGNVRELQNAVRYALVNTRGDLLTNESFPAACRHDSKQTAMDGFHFEQMLEASLRNGDHGLYRTTHDEVDRRMLARVLEHCKGNRKAASELLGISRTTLLTRLRALGLDETD